VSQRKLLAVLLVLAGLVAVIALRTTCASGVAGLFRAYDAPVDAGPPPRAP
jgi:hypothetical protein